MTSIIDVITPPLTPNTSHYAKNSQWHSDEEAPGCQTLASFSTTASSDIYSDTLTNLSRSSSIQNLQTTRDEYSRPLPIVHLLGLTAFNFSYGMICSTMGLFILPWEAASLWPQKQTFLLGALLFLVGFTQLVCPAAGKLSDRARRRQPFLQVGALLGLGSLGLMCFASLGGSVVLFCPALFAGMTALNLLYATQAGLISDLTPKCQEGSASGLVAVQTLVGAQAGFAVVVTVAEYKLADYRHAYILYAILIVLTVGIVLFTANNVNARGVQNLTKSSEDTSKEPLLLSPSTSFMTTSQDDERIGMQDTPSQRSTARRDSFLSEILSAYWIDTSQNVNFLLVFIGRTFYYIAVSCQAFLLYFLRDVMGTRDPGMRQIQLGGIVFVAQGVAASLAYPIGKAADSPRVSKKKLIYGACCVMSFVYVGFLCIPHIASTTTAQFILLLILAAFYGVGNGCFLAVDYALALATLPSKESGGQALGVWGIAAFLGSAIGPLLWGGLIGTQGAPTVVGHYVWEGYRDMLGGGVIFTFASALVVSQIQGVR